MKFHPKSEQPIIYLSGYRPIVSSKKPIVYLSGRHGSDAVIEREWLRRTGCKYRCFSFAYICPGAFYYSERMRQAMDASMKRGVHVMMDSGAHSFHRFILNATGQRSARKKKSFTDVDELKIQTRDLYAEFCRREGKNWDFYVNLDFVKNSPDIYKMQRFFEKQGLNPVPVYHGDSDLSYFERYIDQGHKIIGIGNDDKSRRSWKDKRRYYDELFNIAEKKNIKLHGFAVTSLSYMSMYPWYSVDSSTWVKVASFGQIIVVDPVRNVISSLHVSNQECKGNKNSYNLMPKSIRKVIREQVEARGYDIDRLRTDLLERCTYNGEIFSHYHELKVKGADEERTSWERLL